MILEKLKRSFLGGDMAKNMAFVILRVNAGLGNQLFQYAVAKALAIDTGRTLLLDRSYYKRRYHPYRQQGNTLYPYKLDQYNIIEKKTSWLIEELIGIFLTRRITRNLYVLIQKYMNLIFRIALPKLVVDGDCLSKVSGSSIVMSGYFASYNNFEKHRAEITRSLKFPGLATAELAKLSEEIQTLRTVSIHVRRADYITKPNVKNNFASISLDYYRRAFALLTNAEKIDKALVFSDDIEWCKENLILPTEVEFIDVDAPDYEHHYLMQNCKHHIIANSTFSWWAAWLADENGKTVIAPKNWYQDPERASDIYIPNSWLRVMN